MWVCKQLGELIYLMLTFRALTFRQRTDADQHKSLEGLTFHCISNKKNIRYSLLGPAWKSAQRHICLNRVWFLPF